MTTTSAGVAFGRPAMARLAEQVDELKAGDPLAGVTVVVASNAVAVAARRALAARPRGVANVSFLTLHRLAERLGAPALAAAGRRPSSIPVTTAAVRAVLAEAPGVFAPVADHPATERALVTAHLELATVPDDALTPVAACSPRAGDVVRIHRRVRDRLAAHWYGEQDLLAAAARVPDRLAEAGRDPVIVHLLQDVSAAAATLLGLLRPSYVNVGLTGDPDADAPVLAAHARAGFEPCAPPIGPARAHHVVSASDPDDEVRAAVRLVTGWMHEGTNLGRVALVYATREPYARLLDEQLAAAGIPWNGTPVRELGDLLVGRTLRSLLGLADRDFRRPDVLGLLTGAPFLDGDRRVPGRAWERTSRQAGVVGGGDWDARLANLAARWRREAEALDPEEHGRRVSRKHDEARRADELADYVRRLRADLDAGAGAPSWAAMAGWARRLVTTYLGDETRWANWPEEERTAADRVDAVLERLAGLDALGGPGPTVEVFRRTLEGELAVGVRRVGRLGEGVLVGPVSAAAAGLVLDRLVVLGMAEGAFPPRRLEDPLLPDAERAASGGELPRRAHRVHDDRRHLLAAMASADRTVLCQPRGDLRRSGERPASRWLMAEAARLAAVPGLRPHELARHSGEPWLDFVPSFSGGLVRMPLAASEQDLRLAAVARLAHDHPAITGDGTLSRALEVIGARRSDRFTRFDGNLASVAADIPRPARSSASRLERWAGCPHGYLLRDVLGVEPVEEPGAMLEITPRDRGVLVHDILERFVTQAIDDGHPLDRWGPADEARLLHIAEERFAALEADGRTGRAVFWRRDRRLIIGDLRRFLATDSDRLASGHRPLCAEHQFTSVPVPLPSGHELLVDGKVDRIDRGPDGSLVVLDYKTGRRRRDPVRAEVEAHGRGTELQLSLYALAAEAAFPTGRPVYSAYWYTSTTDGIAGYTVTPAVADAAARAIDVIVEGIAAGVYPARPAAPSSRTRYVPCWYCAPDGLSAADRHRDWERKRLDPSLAGYVGLAEPEVLGGLA